MKHHYRKTGSILATIIGAVLVFAMNYYYPSERLISKAERQIQEAPKQVISQDIHAIDGDTLRAGNKRIRLWGIDAPELHQKCFKAGQEVACGQKAKASLIELVQSGEMTCYSLSTDRYQREVSRCTVNGIDIGSQMVRNGWALDYTTYSKGFYKADEDLARQDRQGVWSLQFDKPSDWRRGVRTFHYKGNG